MLPWAQHERDERSKENQASGYFLDCSRCIEMAPYSTRQYWKCGLLRERERTGPGQAMPHYFPEMSLDVCPGYLMTLPKVVEAGRAYMHWDQRTLEQHYEGDELTRCLLDSLEVVKVAVSNVEAHAMRPR